MRFSAPLVALLSVAVIAIGCGNDSSPGDLRKTGVVATTTQVADFVRNVGGNRVDVHQVLQPNSDPHEYEPRPSDARAVAAAQAVFRSGGDVDDWMGDVISNAGGDALQITLIDDVRTRASADDEVDPHWWQDPRNAELAVKAIRDQLVKADPRGREIYVRNAARYLGTLARLDRMTAGCIAELRPAERRLVTTHDALGYYAARYGLDVIGAVIPSLSTQAQPSAKDVQDLVAQIKATGAKAIYPESSINPKLEEAVARESGAATGDALWADTLGPKGSSGATYVASIASNTAAIVSGLSGGAVDCRPAT
jgi:ABC-type Zn uptake system ZnuABC Zn-binding protein ZnuA